MKYPLKPMTSYDLFRSQVYQILKWPYFTAACFGYVLILLMVMAYLSKAPVFQSEMDLVLPGTGTSSNVSLDEVGQVISSTSTPFSVGGFNPRINYKEMLKSRVVVELAAEKMGMSAERFGVPKVRLTEQTSIINVDFSGTTPKMAMDKAWSLYEALQDELNRLRADESRRRDVRIQKALGQYRDRLNVARSNIIEFQQRSLLVSQDQVKQLMVSLSSLEEKQLYVSAELQRIEKYVNQLSTDLGVSANMAGQAFALQSDSQFRGYLAEMRDTSSQLSEFTSRWGAGHPKVKAELARFEQAKSSLLFRSEQLVGIKAAETFSTMDLEMNPKRAQLFADLIDTFADMQGEQARLNEMRVSSSLLKEKLKVYTRESAELDRLQREFDLAEAVFTSAAARLEAGKADVFASYPVIQLLAEPSYPQQISSPRTVIGLAAGVFGVLFITSGLLVMNKRREIIGVLLKKAP